MKKILLKIYYKILEVYNWIIIYYNKKIVSKNTPIVKNTDETLAKLLSNNISMSRYGDGEFSLIRGHSLKFQPYNKDMAKRIKEILWSEEKNHIVCIPDVFGSLEEYTEDARIYWSKYLNLNRHHIYKLINNNKMYFNTQVTRLYIDTKDKNLVDERFNKIKRIWNKKDLLIVEGSQSRLGIGNDLFENAKSIKRIICPSINAYSKYSEILDKIKDEIEDRLVLIALGPTATILAYDLSKLGYRAIDIGHIDIEYEWFLQGVKSKCPVKYKYIGEIDGGDNVENLTDDEYLNQVIYNFN